MSNADESQNNTEADIGDVLRAAGSRVQPSLELKQAVRTAVHAEWRKTVAGRTKRRMLWAAAAGIVGIAALGFWADLTNRVPHGRDISSGDAYLALSYPGGVSVRLDRHTHIVQVDAQHLVLRGGALYIDSGKTPSSADRLQIQTPAGAVTHLGTQYEIRLSPAGTRIRVREGRVALIGAQGVVIQASEQLTISSDGSTARDRIAPDSPEWIWAEQAAPSLDIEGQSVHAFLDWIGRELGCEVVYATPEAEAEATRAVLRGSTAGLAPAEALTAVLATTHLRSVRRDGRIVVEMQ